jgi:inosine/guanosine/xanthosine phosphorylase family protein
MINALPNRFEEDIKNSSQTLQDKLGDFTPKIAIILGSGLSEFSDEIHQRQTVKYSELVGFPDPVVGGHRGEMVFGSVGATPLVVLRGRSHFYEFGEANNMRVPVGVLKEIGCELLFLTNAAGSMDPQSPPGSLMLLEDTINLAGVSPLFGVAGDQRFVNMTNALDPVVNLQIESEASSANIPLRRGVYAWMTGPQFETPAEIRMLMTMGANCVGMSTVPEIILARYFGLKVVALSIVTNQAAGLSDETLSHTHTFEQAALAGPRMTKLLKTFLKNYQASR